MRTIDLQTQIKFERILLATDFSDDGEITQAYAVGLALQDESALEITTVVTLPSLDAISECALDSVRHSSEEELVRLSKRISGVNVTRKVIEGFQRAGAIVDEAVRSRADLIVLGAHGASAFAAIARAGVVYKVLAHAHCPVMTLSPALLADYGVVSNRERRTEVFLAGVF